MCLYPDGANFVHIKTPYKATLFIHRTTESTELSPTSCEHYNIAHISLPPL